MKYTVPTVETNRLILRAMKVEDAQDLFEICSDDEVTKFLSYKSHESIEETIDTIKNLFMQRPNNGNFEAYVVVDKESGRVIGTCDFISYDGNTVEIGYMYHKDYWGKGIATESLNAVIEVAFNQLNINRIGICHHPDNIASKRVIEKAGFKPIGIERKALITKNGPVDIMSYDLLKEDIK